MRHANLPLQVLASSVVFAPQSSAARFLWREISASAHCTTVRPSTPRAQSSRLQHGNRSANTNWRTVWVCSCSFSFDPQPLRQGVGIAALHPRQ